MASKVKITLTLNETLVRELDRASCEMRRSTSQLVDEALRVWWRHRLALRRGYRAMAGEDRTAAESHLEAGYETIK